MYGKFISMQILFLTKYAHSYESKLGNKDPFCKLKVASIYMMPMV